MSETRTLVIADNERRAKLPPEFARDVRVGWRVICADGNPYDFMWGSVKPEKLDDLLADARAKFGEFDTVDVRGQVDAVRDRKYYDRVASPHAGRREG